MGKRNKAKSGDKTGETKATAAVEDPMKAYCNAVGNYGLLDARQEYELAAQIKAGEKAMSVLKADACGDSVLTEAEKGRLERVAKNGMKAKQVFVCSNLRLVISIAKMYTRSGMPLIELIQFGNMGLIKAVEGFDHERGYKFSTYATSWIKDSVRQGVDKAMYVINIPSNVAGDIKKVVKATERLEDRYGREPTVDEIAKEIGRSHDDTAFLMVLSQGSRSLSASINEEGDYTLMEKVPDDKAPAPHDAVAKKMLPELVRHELKVLTDRERLVVVERYGLDGKPQRKLKEIAKELGLTCERVRQIEQGALEKLRKPCESACLDDYL